jgi:WD40 repeat protein
MLRELGVRDVSATSNSRRLRNACSRFAVEKLALKNTLDGHRGCVNSVLFSWDGTTIYTASDDLYVNLYDTYSEYNDSEDGKQDSIAAQQPKWRIRTKHTNNLFYARDIPHSNKGLIATCAADGRVILMNFEEGTLVVW